MRKSYGFLLSCLFLISLSVLPNAHAQASMMSPTTSISILGYPAQSTQASARVTYYVTYSNVPAGGSVVAGIVNSATPSYTDPNSFSIGYGGYGTSWTPSSCDNMIFPGKAVCAFTPVAGGSGTVNVSFVVPVSTGSNSFGAVAYIVDGSGKYVSGSGTSQGFSVYGAWGALPTIS
ncbi:MAG TPA: hypothetical protein VK503_01790 [Candidatus Bathyarchaeia archaeon]|nr:hypothetical protein [Candidatus Bathyarchaeia archaeon]